MQAFSTLLWASMEAYTVGNPPAASAARPSVAARRPAASRAAASAIRVEVDAVSVRRPSKVAGSPSASRSQPTTTCSSSVPIGEVRQSIGFWPRIAVHISPRTPGADAVVAKYARKPGCCQWVAFGRTRRSTSARMAARGSGSSGAVGANTGRSDPGSIAGRIPRRSIPAR